MQAVRIHAHGGPEVLQVEDIARPKPGPGEVLARVLAVSVNHLDLFVRRGMPGVTIDARFGWPVKTKAVWRKGKKVEERLPQTEPWVAMPSSVAAWS